MPDEEHLTPADPDELAWTLTYALQYDGRRRFKTSGEMMAKITAEHLARCLKQSGYVIMKKPQSHARTMPFGPPKGPSELPPE